MEREGSQKDKARKDAAKGAAVKTQAAAAMLEAAIGVRHQERIVHEWALFHALVARLDEDIENEPGPAPRSATPPRPTAIPLLNFT